MARLIVASLWALMAVMLAGLPGTVWANDDDAVLKTRTAEIITVLKGQHDAASTFDQHFLTDVSADQLRKLTATLVEQGGDLQGFTNFRIEGPGAATFILRFAQASAPARVELSPVAPRKVSGFRIFALTPNDDSFARIDAAFSALPGTAGYAIHRLGDGRPRLVHGLAIQTPFAIGSAFKLYVLATLARQVQEGHRGWSDVVLVKGKSFPGGVVHDFPEGSPVTLHTLASLMISISDNTATDILVRLLGQDALAAEVARSGHAHPERLTPMMTTAQFFALKSKDQSIQRTYAVASPRRRADILADLNLSGVASASPGALLGHAPVAIDQVEWFASPDDLAGIINNIRRLGSREALDILAINKAMDPVTAGRWAYVGYKGGSEAGVINMTWLLRDKKGDWSVLTGSWNDPSAPLDNERFELLMTRLAGLAASR